MKRKLMDYTGMGRERLETILTDVGGVRVAVVGDVCLDCYWRADMRLSKLSRETPHFPLPVVEERTALGGGGNVIANIAALNPCNIAVVTVIGNDWRGDETANLLKNLNADISGVVRDNITTNAYIKPLRSGISDVVYEDPRLDFQSYEPLAAETEERIISNIKKTAAGADILCVCDQMEFGVITDKVRGCIIGLAKQGMTVVADSRDRIGLFTDMIIKPNETEAAAALGAKKTADTGDYAGLADELAEQTNGAVFMTIGENGSVYIDGGGAWRIYARKPEGPVDTCGAGDSSLAGFALALAAGAEPAEAAYIAGLCSGVTIRQIGTTGTATRGEIMDYFTLSGTSPA